MTRIGGGPPQRISRGPASRSFANPGLVAVAALFVIAPPAFAKPAPRLGGALRMVAAGLLPPRVRGEGRERLTVSVRVPGGAEALVRAGFVARAAGPSTAFV